jgi:hypothetical protein
MVVFDRIVLMPMCALCWATQFDLDLGMLYRYRLTQLPKECWSCQCNAAVMNAYTRDVEKQHLTFNCHRIAKGMRGKTMRGET